MIMICRDAHMHSTLPHAHIIMCTKAHLKSPDGMIQNPQDLTGLVDTYVQAGDVWQMVPQLRDSTPSLQNLVVLQTQMAYRHGQWQGLEKIAKVTLQNANSKIEQGLLMEQQAKRFHLVIILAQATARRGRLQLSYAIYTDDQSNNVYFEIMTEHFFAFSKQVTVNGQFAAKRATPAKNDQE